MRRATALLLLVLLPCASAQPGGEEPTLNESDFNSTVPEEDASYLNETDDGSGNATASGAEGPGPGPGVEGDAGPEPTLGEGDFDTSLPEADTSYLDENEPPPAGGTVVATTTMPTPPAGKGTPAPGLAALLAGLVVAALAARRSRDR